MQYTIVLSTVRVREREGGAGKSNSVYVPGETERKGGGGGKRQTDGKRCGETAVGGGRGD